MPSQWQLNAWQKALDDNARQVLEGQTNTHLKAAIKLFARIKELTPVGDPMIWSTAPYWPPKYIPGTLKKSWELSVNNVARDVTNGQFQSVSNLISGHGIQTTIGKISIFNRQPYAAVIEYGGWSHKQAPNGMMRIALKEWPEIVAEAAH